MSEFKIETGVTVPPRKGKESKYPYAGLKEGQSFFVPDEKKLSSIQSGAGRYQSDQRKEGKKDFQLVVRGMENSEGTKGVRVFRIKPEKANGK